jgi:OmpA-OmpF porin, OOP family
LTLIRFPKLQILIKGHTSSEGSTENNQRLSEQRAEAVKNYLIQKGIAAERLQTKGFGATQLISDETTEDNRRLNRRIEFEIKF